MIINKLILTTEYLADCAKTAANFTNAARIITYLKLAASIQGAFLFLITGFEVALFFEVYSFIDDDEENFLSSKMLALTGLVILVTVHILAISYQDSSAVKFIRMMVICLLPFYILGAGFLYSAGLFESLMSIFENGDLEAEIPLLPSWVQEYILPNSIIILTLGMTGFTAFCVFSASYLFEVLKNNVEKIMRLSSDCITAITKMNIITTCQKQHVSLYAEDQIMDKKLDNLAQENAYKIAMEVAGAVCVIDSVIMQKELFLSDENNNSEQDTFTAFFDSDSYETKTIKKMPLDALKDHRDKLAALDEKAVLAIICNKLNQGNNS